MPNPRTMSLSEDSLVTADQLGGPPWSERRCELVAGRLVDVGPAHRGHGAIAADIHAALVLWAAPRDAGRVFSADTGFLVSRDPDTVRAPDAGFLRKDRTGPPGAFVEGAPDVAVEILSPGVSLREVKAKVRDYLVGGAMQVWIVDPEDRTITVHTPDGRSAALGEGDDLLGGDALPGFRLAVRSVFAP